MHDQSDWKQLVEEASQLHTVFLLTSVLDSRPHVFASRFQVAHEDGQVEVRTEVDEVSRMNSANNPAVSLLWPAPDPDETTKGIVAYGEARGNDSRHVVVSITSIARLG